MNLVHGTPRSLPTETQIRQAATRREVQQARRLCQRQQHDFLHQLVALLKVAAGSQDLRSFIEGRLRRQAEAGCTTPLALRRRAPSTGTVRERPRRTPSRSLQPATGPYGETRENPCIGECDGSVCSNSMGLGGVLLRPNRRIIAKFSEPGGILGDVLLAELKAFMALVEFAHVKKVRHLRIYADNKTLVNFLNFDHSAGDVELRRNREYILERTRTYFDSFSIAWRTREMNTEADDLANRARLKQLRDFMVRLARAVDVTPTAHPHLYAVCSVIDDAPHVVDTRTAFCSCPYFSAGQGEKCAHLLAVQAWQDARRRQQRQACR